MVAEVDSLAPDGETVEVDVFATRGALFVLAEEAHVMVCTTNRSVNPGLIFYDMHAVLRDIDRAAAMRRRREVRRPRVRIRVAHGEARVLDEEAVAAGRLLALARELLDEREEAPRD